MSYQQTPLRRPSALVQPQVVRSTEGTSQSQLPPPPVMLPSSLRDADLSGITVSGGSMCLAHPASLNIQGWSEALLARPDVVQLPQDVYICIYMCIYAPHTRTHARVIRRRERKPRPKKAARLRGGPRTQMLEHLRLFLALLRAAPPPVSTSTCEHVSTCDGGQLCSALSHLGKQVIAVSIIYSSTQQSGPQTILTGGPAEMDASAPTTPIHQSSPPVPFFRNDFFFFQSLADFLFCRFCQIFNQTNSCAASPAI